MDQYSQYNLPQQLPSYPPLEQGGDYAYNPAAGYAGGVEHNSSAAAGVEYGGASAGPDYNATSYGSTADYAAAAAGYGYSGEYSASAGYGAGTGGDQPQQVACALPPPPDLVAPAPSSSGGGAPYSLAGSQQVGFVRFLCNIGFLQ
jgi:hypothetical protein